MTDNKIYTTELRLYSFVNYYLSDLQRGLQTAHLVAELYKKYTVGKHKKVLVEWATDHKTIIILNGGNCSGLADVSSNLKYYSERLELPVASFSEDMQSLGGALTVTGIIVDVNALRTSPFGFANTDIQELLTYLSQFRLA
jgi:hypothetical protein